MSALFCLIVHVYMMSKHNVTNNNSVIKIYSGTYQYDIPGLRNKSTIKYAAFMFEDTLIHF
jgi:hypothetical protein